MVKKLNLLDRCVRNESQNARLTYFPLYILIDSLIMWHGGLQLLWVGPKAQYHCHGSCLKVVLSILRLQLISGTQIVVPGCYFPPWERVYSHKKFTNLTGNVGKTVYNWRIMRLLCMVIQICLLNASKHMVCVLFDVLWRKINWFSSQEIRLKWRLPAGSHGKSNALTLA